MLLSFLCTSGLALTQEICDNGVDDDGDGLVDLNDVEDCFCTLRSDVPSLLPNPSFEEYSTDDPECTTQDPNGLPDSLSQISCMSGWLQPDRRTTDALNLLGYFDRYGFVFPDIPLPLPSGTGYAGFYYMALLPSGRLLGGEQLAACLENGALTIGEEYRYSGELGFGIGDSTGGTYAYSYPLLAIYGVRSCAELTQRNEEDIRTEGFGEDAPWEEITRFRVSGSPGNWSSFSVDFTAEVAYEALVITRPFDMMLADLPGIRMGSTYYFADNFRLSTVADAGMERIGNVTTSSDDCFGGLVYTGPIDEQYTYQWYRNGVAIINATNASFRPALAGAYQLRTTVAGECSLSEVLLTPVLPDLVENSSVPDLFPDSVNICALPPEGQSVLAFITQLPTGVTVNYPIPGPSPGLYVTAAGTLDVEVVAECGMRTERITVTVGGPLVTDFVRVAPDGCEGLSAATAELVADPSATATWRTLEGEVVGSSEFSVAGLVTGMYTVNIVSEQTCTFRDTFMVAPATLQIDSIAVLPDCEAAADVQVFSSGGTQPIAYTLEDGRGAEFDVFPELAPGAYTISATDAAGCTATRLVTVTTPLTNARVQIEPAPLLALGDSVTLRWTAAADLTSVEVRWLADPALSCLDCPFPTLQPAASGTYTLQLTDAFGCVTEDSIFVQVDRSVPTYFPTAFSPNGDGVNDVYEIFPGRGVRRVVEFRVFDRWGGLRYESAGDVVGWDGLTGGESAPAGVYVYSGVLELVDGRLLAVRGGFSLLY